MEKCWCEQARLEIDDAWDHPIRSEEGEGGSGCKRLREIMDAEIEYAKACEYCPCRKRVRLEDNVFVVDGKAEICTEDSAIAASESNSSQCPTTAKSCDAEEAIGVDGPCECTVAIARMAALLEQDYGNDKATMVEQSLLPSDDELDEIHQDYLRRARCVQDVVLERRAILSAVHVEDHAIVGATTSYFQALMNHQRCLQSTALIMPNPKCNGYMRPTDASHAKRE